VGACIPRRTWWLRTVNGAGQRVSIAFKSEAEAQEAARKVEAARTLGVDYPLRTPAAPKAPTFAPVAEEALKLYAATRALRPGTRQNQELFLRNHLLPAFGGTAITPEAFSRLEIRRFIARLRDPDDGGLADSTIQVNLPTLRLILDFACERGLLASNPMTGGRLWFPKPGTADVAPFSASEVRTILKAARALNRDFATLIQVMVQGGLRPGEAAGLRRIDVDVSSGLVHVRGSWSLTWRRRGPTKTDKSARTVSILHPVAEDRAVWRPSDGAIETHRVLDGLRVLQALAPDRESPIFPSGASPSSPITSQEFYGTWRRVLRNAGVTYRKPHALRHTFASILLSRGANPLYLVLAGGWTNANILFKVYAKWIEEAADIASMGASSRVTPENQKIDQLMMR